MSKSREQLLETFVGEALSAPVPSAAARIADAIASRYPGAAILLYGSGISVSAGESATDILFDFYVISPDYRGAISNALERLAARAIPPNVYYLELETSQGVLRAKYALLSVGAFERLVGRETFHSYFWARFAQPSRLARCPDDLRPRIISAVRRSIETFLSRSKGLVADPRDWRAAWLAGLNASYRAELRAEAAGRAAKLLDSYGDWPSRVAALTPEGPANFAGAEFAWRLRAVMGAFLSVARLLKATATFRGGIDYIAWKVKRHAGVDVAVRPWERRHPFLAAPIVALRYYRMRAEARNTPTNATNSEPDDADRAGTEMCPDENAVGRPDERSPIGSEIPQVSMQERSRANAGSR